MNDDVCSEVITFPFIDIPLIHNKRKLEIYHKQDDKNRCFTLDWVGVSH